MRVISGVSGNRRLQSKFLLVNCLFLFSGFSSLIYQVIWTRLLVFVFGSTTFATSTVLAVFMGGLALGSFSARKYADKCNNRSFLLCYGLLEFAIGIWALIAQFLFDSAIPIYKAFFEQLHNQIVPFGLLRFSVAAVILLIPTSCMGATLPLMSRFVTQSLRTVGNSVGGLYSINTLGAVLGAMSAGFLLIPNLGMNATLWVAATVNVLLGVSAMILIKADNSDTGTIESSESLFNTDGSPLSADSPDSPNLPGFPETSSSKKHPPVVIATLICFCISGALAMIYEIAWTRSLLMIIGSTTYAFTIMLSTFLIGIFLGSYFASRIVDRLRKPIIAMAVAQLTLCLAGFLSMLFFNFLPEANLAFGARFGTSSTLSMVARFVSAGSIMLPISICLGAIFPIVVKICSRKWESLGHSIGTLYAINTTGAIIGAFLCGFFIIPALGCELTLALTSLLYFLLGIALLLMFADISKSIRIFALTVTSALSAYILLNPPKIHDIASLVYSQSDRRQLIATTSHVKAVVAKDNQWQVATKTLTPDTLKSVAEIEFYKEGPCANVAVTTANPPAAAGKITTLFTNGHPDASDFTDMENQAMLAASSLLLNPRAEDVCVVGWGSGVTVGYALRFPIKDLICAEIEPAVLDTTSFFHSVNFFPENDKRLEVELSDGRNYLLGTKKKFDVIVSEPSNPWQAGVCNLFTREYFRICADRLKPNGLFTLWSQVSEIPTENLVHIYAALETVFPEIFVIDTGIGDTCAIASKTELKISLADLRKKLELPEVKQSLSKFGIQSAEDFISRIRVCPSGLKNGVHGATINTDDRNYLEYSVSKSYESKIYIDENENWFLQNAGEIWNYIDWGPMTKDQKAIEMVKIARSCSSRNIARSSYWLDESLRLAPSPDALCLKAELRIASNDYPAALVFLSEGDKCYPADARFSGLSGVIALRQGNNKTAKDLLERAFKTDNSNPVVRYYLALTQSTLNLGETDAIYTPPLPNPESVIELCEPAALDFKFVKSRPGVLLLLADAYNKVGRYRDSKGILQEYLMLVPEGYLAWQLLGETFTALHEPQQAKTCANKAGALVATSLQELFRRAQIARKQGQSIECLRLVQLVLNMAPADTQILAFLKDYAGSSSDAVAVFANAKKGKRF